MSRKQEIIAGLTEARQRILDALVDLPPNKQNEVFLGIWSIKDLLAHLVGWDFTNIEAATDIRAGRRPRVFEQWDPGWVTYNAELVRKYKCEDFSALLTAIQASHAALLAFVQNLPAADIAKDYGVRSPSGTNVTVAVFLQYEIEDESRHYQQIQEWLTGSNRND
ncbi:MAG: DinB family protein [Caldilinea sp. CFX5]|nr:DinB family protein [Caldilinea sp. CFX5]